jgi:hypothetical protein
MLLVFASIGVGLAVIGSVTAVTYLMRRPDMANIARWTDKKGNPVPPYTEQKVMLEEWPYRAQYQPIRKETSDV